MKSHYFMLLLSFFVSKSFGCPYIITNDTDKPIMIVDPNNHQAVYISPGDKKELILRFQGGSITSIMNVLIFTK